MPGLCPRCQSQAGQCQGSGAAQQHLGPGWDLAQELFPLPKPFPQCPSPALALPCPAGFLQCQGLVLCRHRAHSSPSVFPPHFSSCNSKQSLLHAKGTDRFVPKCPHFCSTAAPGHAGGSTCGSHLLYLYNKLCLRCAFMYYAS